MSKALQDFVSLLCFLKEFPTCIPNRLKATPQRFGETHMQISIHVPSARSPEQKKSKRQKSQVSHWGPGWRGNLRWTTGYNHQPLWFRPCSHQPLEEIRETIAVAMFINRLALPGLSCVLCLWQRQWLWSTKMWAMNTICQTLLQYSSH